MGKLIFTAITSEGGLLPSDFLQTLLSPGSSVPGMEEVSYHLAKGERVTEAVNRSWNRLKGCWENYQRALVKKNENYLAVLVDSWYTSRYKAQCD